MNPIEKLTEKFKEFPGIGERQAKRFVYFLLHKNPMFLKDLGDAILSIKNTIKQCASCYVFFENTPNAKGSLCQTCASDKTDRSSMLVVEKDADYENIKKSHSYRGLYFILGGLVPIVTKDTPSFVRINELSKAVEERSDRNELKEIVLALSLSPQGDHTDTYLREKLSYLQNKYNFKIVSLGRGLSTGTELEYSDSETIKNALKNRT